MAQMKISRRTAVVALLVGAGAPISANADKIDDYLAAQMRQLPSKFQSERHDR
jgi:hypothetical protein